MKDSIIVYSSPTCPKCKMLKLEFTKRGIEFEDFNIETVEPEKLKELGVTHVPTISINGELFDMAKAKE